MKIKGKLTNILFACALLAIVGGENARAISVDAGGQCNNQAAACPTACRSLSMQWIGGDEGVGWWCDHSGAYEQLACICQ